MKILLSYDEHESSQRALVAAQKQAAAHQASLDIVTIVVRESKDQSEDIENAEKILKRAEKECEEKNIACRTKLIIRESSPAEALLEHAENGEYEQIVIGIRRTSKLGKMLLGSNAQHIILNAPCPVLSIGKNV